MSVAPALTLDRRPSGRIRPALDVLRSALDALGAPQRGLRSLLVVGTNGKGSTAALTEAVLRAHGLRTGLYTSPHLVRVEERVRVDGVAVDESTLGRHLAVLDAFPELTYFETLTAAAFSIFAEDGVEVAVLEAGMGGSWDATRLAASSIAGLTNVGTDHRAWLGDDRQAIARDKGAALAAARRAVLGSGVDEAVREALGAPAAVPAAELVQCETGSQSAATLRWAENVITLGLPLAGRHQLANLQLAVALCLEAVAAGWCPPLQPQRLRSAVESVRWPGRLSVHRVAGRELTVDCAHNLEGAEALAEHLAVCGRRFNLLFSCLSDKPVEAMAAALLPRVGEVVVCGLDDERAMPVERMQAAFAGAAVAATPTAGLARLPDPVLAAGSVRLAGALLAAAGEEEPW